MLTIKNKESLIGYRIIGETLSSPWWVVDEILEVVKQDGFGSGANKECYYVIKMQREDNNETKWVKLNRERHSHSVGICYELSCGKQDGSGINKTLLHKEELQNRLVLLNAIKNVITMK